MKERPIIFNSEMIDWENPDWAYLLGVVHGDGNIAKRSICISVGYKDQDYANTLVSLWESLNYSPKVYRQRSALRIDVHNKILRDKFAIYKEKGIWSWPKRLNKTEYLSGVFDADGFSSRSGTSKQIGIILKRSGNLQRLAAYMRQLGVADVIAKDGATTYNGRPYKIESIRICDSARISKLCELLHLRNARKAAMLENVTQYARNYLNRVPRWRKVGKWLAKEGPRDWRQIADEFGLTKAQVDSALQRLREHANVDTIPPVIILTKYEMKGWKDK